MLNTQKENCEDDQHHSAALIFERSVETVQYLKVLLIPIRFAPAAFPNARRLAPSAIQCDPPKRFYGTSRRDWY